jgi:hypothetical protein
MLLRQLSSKQWVCSPTCGRLSFTTPFPPFLGPLSLPLGHCVTGRGRSHCWSAPNSYAPTRVSHGSITIWHRHCHIWRITIKGTPLQVHRSQSAVLWGSNKVGGERDDPGERRHWLHWFPANGRPRRTGLHSSLLAKSSFYLPAFEITRSYRTTSVKGTQDENFFGSNFEFCTVSLLVMLKY